jgi:hypothetical protein
MVFSSGNWFVLNQPLLTVASRAWGEGEGKEKDEIMKAES